ncbi:nad(h) dehydrogenase [Colletotrichum incanum]|uniref:Nad(H) dehydrogenase n=1 Tax=Colletotrichum incanum TaxID=1573173 RepID=A0A167EAA5_COLIC|nr:nad(h) dehydrogenase [Colletotrichum incanum]
MKGHVERVISLGFGYNIGEDSDKHWGDRFGEGKWLRKPAMLVVTAGGWEEHLSARGIAGPIEDPLIPITLGMLFETGIEVPPSFVMHMNDRLEDVAIKAAAAELRQELPSLFDTMPIAYQQQSGGDYETLTLVLKPRLEIRVTTRFSLHRHTVDEADGARS